MAVLVTCTLPPVKLKSLGENGNWLVMLLVTVV